MNGSQLRSNQSNITVLVDFNTTAEYIYISGSNIYLKNIIDILGYTCTFNLTTKNYSIYNSQLNCSPLITPGGGGGGINPILLTINATLCNYTLQYINQYESDYYGQINQYLDKIKDETNITFSWTDFRNYLDNWQYFCSDLLNISLKEDIVCARAKDFVGRKYSASDILNATNSLESQVKVSTNLFIHYIEYYSKKCEKSLITESPITKKSWLLIILFLILGFITYMLYMNKKKLLLIMAKRRKDDKK